MAQEIWGEGPRVFISHATSTRQLAGELREMFGHIGVSAFVAHEDIQPTEQWQEVILDALSSADVFLPIFSEDFRKSDYCAQELGFAISERRHRSSSDTNSPLIIVAFMQDNTAPYGFISNEQAAKFRQTADIRRKVLDALFEKNFNLWFRPFICMIQSSGSFATTNRELAPYMQNLQRIEKLTIEQARELAEAVNGNNQVLFAFDFMEAMLGEKMMRCPHTGQLYSFDTDDTYGRHVFVKEDVVLPW